MIDPVPPGARPKEARAELRERVGYDPELDAALRRLARRLVGDPGDADDVVQDAWHAALATQGITRPGAWLATLTRRIAARRRYEAKRREDIEHLATAPAASEADRSAAIASLEDALAGLVGRRREVLWLRYAEGLKLQEIAERLRIPLGTVKSDHAEGLSFLRRRMDRRYGSRAAWAIALFPPLEAAPPPSASPPLSAPALAWFTVAAVAVSVSVATLWRAADVEPQAADAEPTPAWVPFVQLAPATPLTVLTPARRSIDAPPTDAPLEDDTPTSSAVLRVVVHDGDKPLAGGIVRALGKNFEELARAATGPDGSANFDLPSEALREPLQAGGGPVCALALGAFGRAVRHFHFVELDAETAREVRIELSEPELTLTGHVVSENGEPLPGARIWIDSGGSLRESVGPGHWRQVRTEFAETDANGAFTAARLMAGVRQIKVAAPGHIGRELELAFPNAGHHSLPQPIALQRAPEIHGVVKDALGQPVAGARLWLEHQENRLDHEHTFSERDGSFSIATARLGRDVLWASFGSGADQQTASVALDLAAGERIERELQLSAHGLGTLRLSDETGELLTGWRVIAELADTESERKFAELLYTDAEGLVRFERDPGGPVRVRIVDLPPGAQATQMPVASFVIDGPWEGVRDHTVEGANAPRARLTGRFIDLEGGNPTALDSIIASLHHIVSVRLPVAADGSFTVSDLPAGEYVLYTSRPSGVVVGVAFPPLVAGETRDLGELRIGSTTEAIVVRD